MMKYFKRAAQSRSIFTALFIVWTFAMVSGCAVLGYSSLSPNEAEQINKIYVGSVTISGQPKYVSLATTAFGNKYFDIPYDGYFRKFRRTLITELKARGYTVVDKLSESHYGINLKKSTTDNYPSGAGVPGAGYFVHNRFLANNPIQLQVQMTATLYYPQNKKQRNAVISTIMADSELHKEVSQWSDYNANEQQYLINALDNAQQPVVAQLLDRLNLLAK